MIELATGLVITRPKWTPCRITDMVVKQVEDMATKQGLKTSKFFDCKRRLRVMQPVDLQLKGVDGLSESSVVQNDNVLGMKIGRQRSTKILNMHTNINLIAKDLGNVFPNYQRLLIKVSKKIQ